MRQALNKLPPVIRFFAACSIAAVLALIFPFFMPTPQAQRGEPTAQETSSTGYVKPLPAIDVEAALERPLFHENRRKAEARKEMARPVSAPRQQAFTFSLSGILGSEQTGRTAYIFDSATSETIAAKVGTRIGDWTIVDVSRVSVTMEGRDGLRTIDLNGGK